MANLKRQARKNYFERLQSMKEDNTMSNSKSITGTKIPKKESDKFKVGDKVMTFEGIPAIVTKVTNDWITVKYTKSEGNIKKGDTSDYDKRDLKKEFLNESLKESDLSVGDKVAYKNDDSKPVGQVAEVTKLGYVVKGDKGDHFFIDDVDAVKASGSKENK